MGDSKTYIENSIIANGGIAPKKAGNTLIQYKPRQKQYYAERNKAFVAARAKYASDYVQAQVQGIDDEDFYRYFTTNIRLADTASLSYSSSKNVDDVKVILFDEPQIDYFPIGAKVKTMGSTWICTNPCNLSDVTTQAIIQRCNAAYCLYDYYGNIVTEPIVVEKAAMQSNDNNAAAQNLVLMEGYFNIIAQKNEYTDLLGLNQRIILGKYAYFITGFTDFIQEFTADYDSVHLYRFSARIEEPTKNDDLVNHIANGLNYSFAAEITGANAVSVKESIQLTAHFIKNGAEVESTTDNPVAWNWTSNNPEIATVTPDGVVTGNLSGTATIAATMAQNANLGASVTITVEEASTEPSIRFIGVVPASIEQYSSATVTAGYYEGDTLTDNEITYAFSGASANAYSITQSGNTLTIMCLKQSDTPLTITATYSGYSVSAEIELEGY